MARRQLEARGKHVCSSRSARHPGPVCPAVHGETGTCSGWTWSPSTERGWLWSRALNVLLYTVPTSKPLSRPRHISSLIPSPIHPWGPLQRATFSRDYYRCCQLAGPAPSPVSLL